jgi:hypothetical protein
MIGSRVVVFLTLFVWFASGTTSLAVEARTRKMTNGEQPHKTFRQLSYSSNRNKTGGRQCDSGRLSPRLSCLRAARQSPEQRTSRFRWTLPGIRARVERGGLAPGIHEALGDDPK